MIGAREKRTGERAAILPLIDAGTPLCDVSSAIVTEHQLLRLDALLGIIYFCSGYVEYLFQNRAPKVAIAILVLRDV